MRHYEAPESVKYHGGYDPSDPPFDPEAIAEEVCPVCDKLSCVCPLEDEKVTWPNRRFTIPDTREKIK